LISIFAIDLQHTSPRAFVHGGSKMAIPPGESLLHRRLILILVTIRAAGFAVRVGVRMALARNISGRTAIFCLTPRRKISPPEMASAMERIARRPPLYVALLALATLDGQNCSGDALDIRLRLYRTDC
jgi:hypothetical protein